MIYFILYLFFEVMISVQVGSYLGGVSTFLEIMASGGLDEEQYEQIGDINVLQAHIASLYDTIMDTATGGIDYDRTDKEIARLVYDTVGSKIIKIHMK